MQDIGDDDLSILRSGTWERFGASASALRASRQLNTLHRRRKWLAYRPSRVTPTARTHLNRPGNLMGTYDL
jgi:hypothetical protein